MRNQWIGAVSDTYLLNFLQLTHMVVLAGVVPWQIGMGAYGMFAAIIALPSIAQSFFETFCLMSVTKHGRIDVIVRPIVYVVVPLLVGFALAFIVLLDFKIAFLALAVTTGLFLKSLSFALVVSSVDGVATLVKSEVFTLVTYLVVFSICWLADALDGALPMVMVSSACFVSASYLIWQMIRSGLLSAEIFLRDDTPKISFLYSGRVVATRSFEEGVLTLSPLMLAATISPVVAGQFRVFVSVVKLVYKLFPFRHDILFVDVWNRRRGFREIAIASSVVAGVSILFGAVGAVLIGSNGNPWIWIMTASLGAIVSSLALFPVSTSIDKRLLYFYLVGIVATHGAAHFGFVPFLIALLFLSFGVLASTLVVLRRFMEFSSLPES